MENYINIIYNPQKNDWKTLHERKHCSEKRCKGTDYLAFHQIIPKKNVPLQQKLRFIWKLRKQNSR